MPGRSRSVHRCTEAVHLSQLMRQTDFAPGTNERLTERSDIGVRRAEEPHIDRDLRSRTFDRKVLVESSRRLQQRRFLGRSEYFRILSVLERSRTEIRQSSGENNDFSSDVRLSHIRISVRSLCGRM